MVALALAAGCGLPEGDYFGPVPEVDDPYHLRWCNYGQPEGLDPAQISSTSATPICHILFDGLTRYGDDGRPEPSLATSWDITPDQRRATFHMHDRGRWSNGRPITAYDVAYQVVRVLHPLTASPSAENLGWIKNGNLFLESRAKVLLVDAGGLPAGTVVEVTGWGGQAIAAQEKAGAHLPDSNRRTARAALALRDLGAAAGAAYATVPAGSAVTVIEVSGRPATLPSPGGAGAPAWAYVHWDRGDGVFGWVPAAELDGQPNGDVRFTVRPVAKKQTPGLDAPLPDLLADARDAASRAEREVLGRDLLGLPEVLGVRVPDEHTFVVEAADPTPHIIVVATQRVMRPTPREAVSRWPRRWDQPAHIVTSGPMHLAAEAERDYLELVRSPTYWDAGDVKLDRLTIYSMDDQAASANTYFTGRCDVLRGNNVPTSYLPVLAGEKRGGKAYKDYTVAPYLGVYFIMVNTKAYDNVHLRRALAYSLDRALIPRVLHGEEFGVASYTPGTPIARLSDEDLATCGVTRATPGVALVIEPGKLCYVPPAGLEFDPVKAKAELAIARREMGARFPTAVSYKFNTGVESHKLVAEYVQAQWKSTLGIDVTLESQEWQVFLADTRKQQFQTARLGWIGNAADPEGEFAILWRCDNPNNRTKWCSPDYDGLLDEAATMTDRPARLLKVAEAERVMIEAAPIIPLYNYTQKHLIKPYVRGLPINFIDQQPIWRAWRDPDWRRHAGNEK
jgi:oligopeptide transport system substrate-binding protein